MQLTTLSCHPRREPRSGGREGDLAVRVLQVARLGAGCDRHGWIPFPALRAAGDDTFGGAGCGRARPCA
jgi:hypothetical protein